MLRALARCLARAPLHQSRQRREHIHRRLRMQRGERELSWQLLELHKVLNLSRCECTWEGEQPDRAHLAHCWAALHRQKLLQHAKSHLFLWPTSCYVCIYIYIYALHTIYNTYIFICILYKYIYSSYPSFGVVMSLNTLVLGQAKVFPQSPLSPPSQVWGFQGLRICS